MKSYIVMDKILVMLEICSLQYSVKLFGIGTLCFKNMNNLKIVEKTKTAINHLGPHFSFFHAFTALTKILSLAYTVTLLKQLKNKEYYYNGGHKAVQKGRLPTLSFSSRHLCFQPTPASNKLQNSTIIQWVDLLYGSAI